MTYPIWKGNEPVWDCVWSIVQNEIKPPWSQLMHQTFKLVLVCIITQGNKVYHSLLFPVWRNLFFLLSNKFIQIDNQAYGTQRPNATKHFLNFGASKACSSADLCALEQGLAYFKALKLGIVWLGNNDGATDVWAQHAEKNVNYNAKSRAAKITDSKHFTAGKTYKNYHILKWPHEQVRKLLHFYSSFMRSVST